MLNLKYTFEIKKEEGERESHYKYLFGRFVNLYLEKKNEVLPSSVLASPVI